MLTTLLLCISGAFAALTATPDTDITTETAVTFAGTAGHTMYNFSYSSDGTIWHEMPSGAANHVVWTFGTTGTCTVQVHYTDFIDMGWFDPITMMWFPMPMPMPAGSDETTITVGSAVKPLTAVALSADTTSPVLATTPVTFTATATGGTSVQYLFSVRLGSGPEGYLGTGDYATSNASDPFAFPFAGTWTVTVYAKEGDTEVSDSKTFTVRGPMTGGTLGATPASPVLVGQQVKLLATPIGGAKAWVKFDIEKQDAEGAFLPVSTRAEAIFPSTLWTPTAPGTYRVTATVRERSVPSTDTFTDSLVIVVMPRISAVALEQPTPAVVAVGTPVTAEATVTGGLDPRLRYIVGYRATPYGPVDWDKSGT